jgi:release factor glutamine methyltransferase
VLIPRPESELLVELALELEPATLLDVGTGSGALALAAAEELPAVAVTATDVSEQALAVARTNAARLGLEGRVDFVSGSLPAEGSSFDLVLANLPYIPEADWSGLAPEITGYEPRVALLSGADGLDAIRSLIRALAPRTGTISAAAVGLEIGHGQGAAVVALLERAGFARAEIRADLAGLQRCVVAEAPD